MGSERKNYPWITHMANDKDQPQLPGLPGGAGGSGNEPPKNIVPRNVEDEMSRSYVDYSMSVIIGRAIPDARDGLKPVHRRILYTMMELGLRPNRAHRTGILAALPPGDNRCSQACSWGRSYVRLVGASRTSGQGILRCCCRLSSLTSPRGDAGLSLL